MQPTGVPITEDQLKDAVEKSGIRDVDNYRILPEIRAKCSHIISYPNKVEPNECSDALIYLKTNFNLSN